jgi:hypothetical protein
MGVGMGFGQLFMILLLVAAFYGSTKLPGDSLTRMMRGEDPSRPSVPVRGAARWTAVDWLLLATTLAIAVTLAVAVAQGR